VVLVAVAWLVGALAPRFACVSISGGSWHFFPYLLALAAFVGPLRVRAYLLLFVCPWVCGMCVCGGGGALSGGVWCPPFGYVRVSLIPCFFPCGRPRV
jgi:hypothetical protein